MSTDASAGEDPGEVTSTDYDQMLDRLDDAIEEAHRKVESGRVYDPENERCRQGWVKTLAYAMNVRRQIAQDRDLEELAEKVERLKEREGTSR